jgi:hypothetical protein
MEVLAILARIKKAHPELRIGQIIGNSLPANFHGDPFYISDAEFAENLKKFEELIQA